MISGPEALAQTHIGEGEAAALFQRSCAACHGSAGEGGRGGSLLRENWKYFTGNQEDGLARIIRDGIPNMEMPGFAGKLGDAEIRSLVIYIEEARLLDERKRANAPPPDEKRVYRAAPYAFRLETIFRSATPIWGLAFLPDGRLVFTERFGNLGVIDPRHPEGVMMIEGPPTVRPYGEGGLMDVAVDPASPRDPWIYLTFTESRTGLFGSGAMVAVARGHLRDGRWVDQQDLFHLPTRYFSERGIHFGSRIAVKNGFLYFSVGDRGEKALAQDLTTPNGKIFRLTEDGRIPPDNPFAKAVGPLAAIWSSGHRNPQGLAFEPGTDRLWESEHGPRGGDEINVIEGGRNYGWPLITYGMNEDGTPITGETARPGLEQPAHYWTPSIAVCGIDFYEGDQFPDWRGSLFAGGLRSEELHRMTVRGDSVVGDEVVLQGAGRVRDVANGPDGTLYLALNSPRGNGSRIVRLVPAETSQSTTP